MQTTFDTLTHLFFQAAVAAFPDAAITPAMLVITPSTQEKFGHYQCNSAMKLAGLLAKNPREIAQILVSKLPNDIARFEVAGPGFINIILHAHYLESRIQAMLLDPMLGVEKVQGNPKLVIDFSSPNTAKEMHVGHLRSTIIGDCLARLFEFLGYDVLRLNHVGDWGTSFGMLIAYLKEQQITLRPDNPELNLTQLVHWYRQSKRRFDEDPEFKRNAQQEVVSIQRGDPDSLQLWRLICDISRRAYQEIYDLLDVHIIERGESFYNPFLPEVVEELTNKNLVTVSDGAKCIFLPGFTNRDGELLPLIIEKSDGGYNYATTDLAAIRHRILTEHASRIIILTDAGQAQHFQMIFQTAIRAGYLDPSQVTVNHVSFGLVLGPDGKKFRTRAGETERLLDLLMAAIDHARDILKKRSPSLSEAELDSTAKILGINAIKYADLAGNRTGDYVFSYERMLRFEGNTALFLLYAYVRVNGIKRKMAVDIQALQQSAKIKLEHPTELALAVQLNRFNEILMQMSVDLYPHRLTEYLYHLAEHFHAFFRDCRVEGDPAWESRLLLCEAVAKVMRQGLNLLGLHMLEKL